MPDRADPQLPQRKIRDRSVVLLLIGSVLLLPPVAGLSLIDVKLAGVPFALLYIFAVWGLLILGAALLAGPLLASERGDKMPARDPDPAPTAAADRAGRGGGNA